MRLVSWNCNGIRNLFDYYPWCSEKSFEFMFKKLEADIICFQETKIQRKDLTYDMINVPGYFAFYTFSKKKKGYSGVAIYVKQSFCTPLKAEEGITGRLLHADTGVPYIESPESVAIGGYTKISNQHALELDQEGRSIVLDLNLFVLFGVYCPLNSDPERSKFRRAWMETLDHRIRNLKKMGRNIIIMGDINASRDAIDTSYALEEFQENNTNGLEDLDQRAWLNKILLPHPEGFMIDLCRHFHPNRKGMFTCWNAKINARPCNFGTRIDYILVNQELLPWFEFADIQMDIMGSDHCPIFAEIKSKLYNWEKNGTYINGVLISKLPKPPRLEAHNFLEFASRDIISMFKKQEKQNIQKEQNLTFSTIKSVKRIAFKSSLNSSKKKRLESFLNQPHIISYFEDIPNELKCHIKKEEKNTSAFKTSNSHESKDRSIGTVLQTVNTSQNNTTLNKNKPSPPLCNVHQKPCIELQSKKPGINFKRYFWICSKYIFIYIQKYIPYLLFSPVRMECSNQDISDFDMKNKFKCDYFKWSSNHNQKSSTRINKK
ncbi:unnamed protein product [Pneumocystis jirovecii]|uniref:DNA-(apurinic or apyrimidinic site) endonuclease n=1 Tax=Pneumocystis jirovecii TaxID=42068 RepID=L0PBX9_PNEJI|nr:unnamed protein product [Pneumocystis jirovecii]